MCFTRLPTNLCFGVGRRELFCLIRKFSYWKGYSSVTLTELCLSSQFGQETPSLRMFAGELQGRDWFYQARDEANICGICEQHFCDNIVRAYSGS